MSDTNRDFSVIQQDIEALVAQQNATRDRILTGMTLISEKLKHVGAISPSADVNASRLAEIAKMQLSLSIEQHQHAVTSERLDELRHEQVIRLCRLNAEVMYAR